MNGNEIECKGGTLLGLCADLRGQLSERESALQHAQLIKSIQSDIENLREHAESAETILQSVRVFKEAKISNINDLGIGADNPVLQKKIEALKKRVESNPDKIRAQNHWADFIQLARKMPQSVRSKLATKWQRYVGETIPSASAWRTFEALPKCEATVSKMTKIEERKEVLQNSQTIDPKAIEEVNQLAESMRKLVADLNLDDQPEEMVDFLKRCAQYGGVPLDELSDEILLWLRENGFASSLRITTS